MQKQYQVAVFFGGASNEYEVSLRSAASVLRNIDRTRWAVTMIGITKDGRWFYYDGPVDDLEADRWQQNGHTTPALLSPERGQRELLILSEPVRRITLDAVFPVLHGKNGEDGTIQGLFELAGLPYVGCGVLASAACMDKDVTHTMLTRANIPNANWRALLESSYRFEEAEPMLREALGYPMFVKPANAGSSVGISKANDAEELKAAIELAFRFDSKVVVEETVRGIEVECAVMGNEAPVASCIGEIEPVTHDFYDYEAKYTDNSTNLYIPARIPDETAALLRRTAVEAFMAMGCSGLSRVDFFVCEGGSIILNEINTLPGFTSISMYPKLFMHDGMQYSEIIDRLLTLALEKAPNKY